MFGHSKSKKGGLCTLCSIVEIILCVLAVLASVAAVIGVYQAHALEAGWAFGTTSGSLSLIALVVTLMLLKKCMMSCSCKVSMKK